MNPLRRLFSYTFRFKFSFFVSIIGFLMFAAADIAAVEWIRRIIEFINSDKTDFSIYLVLALIFIALGRGIGFFIGNYFMSRVGFGKVHDLRSELFAKLINLPKMYFDQNQSGQLINRITFTTTQVSGAASNAIKTFVREGFLLIGLMIYMLSLNWKLTLLLLITTPFIALLVYVAGKLLSKYTECYGTFVRSDVPNECPPFLIGSIFILLSGLCDNVVDVHKMSMNALQILAESGFNGQGVGGLLLVLYPTLYPFILEKCTDWDVSKRVNALGVLAESMKLILEAKNDERSPIEERCMIDIISQLCECCIDEDDELESFNAICKCCKTFAVKRETVEVALTIACGRLGHGSILISGYSSIEHVAATLIILSRLLEGMSIFQIIP